MPAEQAYSPDELARVRDALGIRSPEEAARLVPLFVKPDSGIVYSTAPEKRTEHDELWAKSGKKKSSAREVYKDRVNMDRFLELPEFEIKSFWQVLLSKFSFFRPPPDKISAYFIKKRLPLFCKQIEELVTTIRLLFPRNNSARGDRLKRVSPFSYQVLNIIRHWNLSKINVCLGHFLAHPKNIFFVDMSDLLRQIYRPIVVLNTLDPDEHIKFVVNKLFKVLLEENSPEIAGLKRKEAALRITFMVSSIMNDVRFGLYPLLMKLLCRKVCPYDIFFVRYKHEILNFLELNEENLVVPPVIIDAGDELNEKIKDESKQIDDSDETWMDDIMRPSLENSMKTGLELLCILFPESGWDRPWDFPDFYQYFGHVFPYKTAVEHLDRKNPVLQVLILSNILEDLFSGWRTVSLNLEAKDEEILFKLIFSWHSFVENMINQNYLKLLAELFDYFSTAQQFRKAQYGDKLHTEIMSFAKLKLLPRLQYSVISKYTPPSAGEERLFEVIEQLHHYTEDIAVSVHKNLKELSAIKFEVENKTDYFDLKKEHSSCLVKNPGDPYVFDVPTPVTKRLASLIPKENRTVALLVNVTFQIVAVLHYLINDEESWAYKTTERKIFRSSDKAGIVPSVFSDMGINPDNIFKMSIESLRVKAQKFFSLE